METENQSSFASPIQNAIKHGLITGGLLILYSLLTYALDMMQNRALSYVSFILMVGGMYYGTKVYRDQVLGGMISYSKAFGSAFLIGVIASLFLSVYIFFFYRFFAPEMIEVLLDQAEQEILRSRPGISDEELDMALSMATKFTSPVWLSVLGFFTNAIVSLIIGLILGLLLRREDPQTRQMI